MQKEVAKMILGIDPQEMSVKDVLEDYYEEAIYQEIQPFIKKPFNPKLATLKIEKLKKIVSAASSLGLDFSNRDEMVDIDSESQGLFKSIFDVSNWYYEVETNYKFLIANSYSPKVLESALIAWKRIFAVYTREFLIMWKELNLDQQGPDEIDSSPLIIDTTELLQELKDKRAGKMAKREFLRLSQYSAAGHD